MTRAHVITTGPTCATCATPVYRDTTGAWRPVFIDAPAGHVHAPAPTTRPGILSRALTAARGRKG